MAVFIHLADKKDEKSISRGGIKIGKYRNGIYCLPVTSEFMVSHQWLRELKRRGINSIVGVYFRVPNEEEIWYGHYHNGHEKDTISNAIKKYLLEEDKLGYEFLIPRRINGNEIIRIKDLPQNIGWRYHPQSHSEKKLTCGCPMCIRRGEINGAKKREKFEEDNQRMSYQEIMTELSTTSFKRRKEELLWSLQRKRWKADPRDLEFILETGDRELIKVLCFILPQYKHPNAVKMLREIANNIDPELHEAVAEGMIEIDPVNYRALLGQIIDEEIIERVKNE